MKNQLWVSLKGGIDSPYLFNVYLSRLDEYVHTEVQSYIDTLNNQKGIKKGERKRTKSSNSLVSKMRKNERHQILIMKTMTTKTRGLTPKGRVTAHQKELEALTSPQLKQKLYTYVREKGRLCHLYRFTDTTQRNQIYLRIFYVRYADDWILLTNGDKQIAEKIKTMIADFLTKNLRATLSKKKTLVTNINKSPAHFLGYEVMAFKDGRLLSNPQGTGARRSTGQDIKLAPDRQRLISRHLMKGFCDVRGFPISMPWMSTMEAYLIVERFNACIRGLAQYYVGFVTRSSLNRWIYILRYSCLKTLAQKYKCSISKIFIRFGHNMNSKSTATVSIPVRLAIGLGETKQTFKRKWTLLTLDEVIKSCEALHLRTEAGQRYQEREKGLIGDYPLRSGKVPTVTNEDYLEKISWVSARTEASLGMPCSVCGCFEDVEMHHIKHVRKRAYSLIPREATWQQVLALRNRKQLPVCKSCHDRIHAGSYSGQSLIELTPIKKLIDNRIVHVESFVKLGKEYHSKDLIERGWVLETSQYNSNNSSK